MTFDLPRILESKLAHRRDLARRPVAEKLAMLDALRNRVLAIRAAVPHRGATEMEIGSSANSEKP